MYLDAAGKATEESVIGYRASGVPGTVRGLEYAREVRQEALGRKWCALPWISPPRGFHFRTARRNPLKDAKGLEPFPETETHFPARRQVLRDGRNLCSERPGAHAGAHRRLGPMTFTRGDRPPAGQGHGGARRPHHLEDLRATAVVEREPLTGSYRLRHSSPAPSAEQRRHRHFCRLWACWRARVTRRRGRSATRCTTWRKPCAATSPNRAQRLGDADFVKVPVAGLPGPRLHPVCAARSNPLRPRPAPRSAAALCPMNPRKPRTTASPTRGQHRPGHLHPQRRLRQQGDGRGSGISPER